MTPEAQQQQEEAQQQQEERRQAMLVQVLQPQARERCEHPNLVHPIAWVTNAAAGASVQHGIKAALL